MDPVNSERVNTPPYKGDPIPEGAPPTAPPSHLVPSRPGSYTAPADGMDASVRVRDHRQGSYSTMSPQDWLDWLRRDPDAAIEAFAANYEQLPDAVKNNKALQLAFEKAVQDQNRTFSFLSNFLRAKHETLKEMISRIQV